jgi:aspartate kinase
VAFEEMLELASQGAKVLQVRSVELGMTHNMPIFVRSSFDKPEDIDPHGTPPGTLICSEEEIMESHVVTGIAFSKDEAQISVRQIEDKPGVARLDLRAAGRSQHQCRHDRPERLRRRQDHDLTFTVPATDYARAKETITGAGGHRFRQGRRFRSSASACAAMRALRRRCSKIGYARIDSATDVAKVSVIGSACAAMR